MIEEQTKQREPSPGARKRSRWVEQVESVDRRGIVHVRLREEQRSLLVRLSPSGAEEKVLVQGRFGDVAYSAVTGFPETKAVEVARAYAVLLERGASPVPKRLPHLAVAAASGRVPGSCRTTLAELWTRGTLPSPRDELRLDPAGLVEFLAPELCPGLEPVPGFRLRTVRLAPLDTNATCVLEFESALDPQASPPLQIGVGVSVDRAECFGAAQLVSIVPWQGIADQASALALEEAELCSWLVALIELKQLPAFRVSVPARVTVTVPCIPPERSPSAETTPAESPKPSSSESIVESRDDDTVPVERDAAAEAHRFDLLASGYTVLRQVIPPEEVAALAQSVDEALEATRAAVASGRELAYLYYDESNYVGTRCVYCWGEACLRLLENDELRRFARAIVGPHRLFDMTAHRALPSAALSAQRTGWWHRDIDVFEDSPPSVRYLWYFVLLDEFTADNGATWVVPGSQRVVNVAIPEERYFSTAVQILGQPGDVIAINPSALHSVGHNVTNRPRTLINVGVCHVDVRPLLDHWSIAGPRIQAHAGPRLREMLGADERQPNTTWSVLPEGWVTSRRPADHLLPERDLPIEQRGFERRHHRRSGRLMPDRPGVSGEDE